VNTRQALALCLLASLGGCGTASSPSASPPPSLMSSSSTTALPAFPLTIARSGGIAGLADTVVIKADGASTVTSRTSGATSCRISSADLVTLSGQVLVVITAATTSATPDRQVADAIHVTLTAGDRAPFTMSEPPDPAPPAVGRLLDDVTGASPAYQICRKS